MPEADVFEAPVGGSFHGEPLLQSVTEAFVGNGVLANGDAEVTADSGTQMGLSVAAASDGIAYAEAVYTPTSSSFTLSDGPTTTTNGQDDRRVDIVYFDSSAAAYGTTEGAADPNPTPPAVPSDALLLAIVYIAHEATDITDSEIVNWRARPNAASKSGSGAGTAGPQEAEFAQGLHIGYDPRDTISETSTPKGFTYTAGDGRDIHRQTDVTISNSSGASATEDITVELYDGADTTGTLLQSETKSISLADGGSTTSTFITSDESLDGGDYHINVTQSGTDLSVDQTDESTQGLEWSFIEQDDGTHDLVNRYTGTAVISVDPITDEISFPTAAIDTTEIADASVTTAKLANDAVTAAKIGANAVGNTQMANDAIGAAEIAALASGMSSVTNPGVFGALFDTPVDSTPTAGDEQSFTLSVDGTTVLKIFAEADGAGAIQNARTESPVGDRVDDRFEPPSYADKASVPTDMREGGMAWTRAKNRYVYEDGT